MIKTSSNSKAQPPRQKSWKVLVIEDDARWRTVIEMQLQTAGHTVLTAADGLAGLAMAAQKPDVILCDIEMPRLNGFGVLEALRPQPVLTAVGHAIAAEEAATRLLGHDSAEAKVLALSDHRFGCVRGGERAVVGHGRSIFRTSSRSSPVISHSTSEAGTSPTASKAAMYCRIEKDSPSCCRRRIRRRSSISLPMT